MVSIISLTDPRFISYVTQLKNHCYFQVFASFSSEEVFQVYLLISFWKKQSLLQEQQQQPDRQSLSSG